MEQLAAHWTDFHEVLYLHITLKSVQKVEVSLKSDKNNRYIAYLDLRQFYLFRVPISVRVLVYRGTRTQILKLTAVFSAATSRHSEVPLDGSSN
jgi:hypothetical protein